MAEGWCKFHRPLLSNPLWLSEPFTRGQAWVDLFALAGHGPSSIRVRGIKVQLERGQLGYSELTLSERWKWSRGKVRRFLRELENDQMLATRQDNKTTIITILNYNKYQGEDSCVGTANDTASGTPNGHQTDTIKNQKNREKEYTATPEAGAPGDSSIEPGEAAPEPKPPRAAKDPRPKGCPPEAWDRYLKISRGYHRSREAQLGRQAPYTELKAVEGAKTLDTLIRAKGYPELEVISVLGWASDDQFWSSNLRSIGALLKKSSSNGELKYGNVLASMTRDLERKRTQEASRG